jgi:hypothetical protein
VCAGGGAYRLLRANESDQPASERAASVQDVVVFQVARDAQGRLRLEGLDRGS